MSVLRNLESKLAGLVEGTFSRAFKSEVRPVEIARKLAREMDEHRVQSLSRIYAPNEYAVWLSPEDREQFAGYEDELRGELSGYLLEHARRERRRAADAAGDQLQDRRPAAARRVRDPGPARAAGRGACGRAEPGRGGPHDGLLDLRAACPSRCASRPRGAGRRGCGSAGAPRCSVRRRGAGPLARVRHRARRRQRFAPPRRGPAVGWLVDGARSRVDQRREGQRARVEPTRAQSLKPGDVVELGTSRATFDLE